MKKSFVALAASTAVFVPMGAAVVPAAANEQNGLVNVYAKDIANGNQIVLAPQVSIPVAAALCGVNANVLSLQLASGNAKCAAQSNSQQNAWVSFN
jgi:hypothetical protein